MRPAIATPGRRGGGGDFAADGGGRYVAGRHWSSNRSRTQAPPFSHCTPPPKSRSMTSRWVQTRESAGSSSKRARLLSPEASGASASRYSTSSPSARASGRTVSTQRRCGLVTIRPTRRPFSACGSRRACRRPSASSGRSRSERRRRQRLSRTGVPEHQHRRLPHARAGDCQPLGETSQVARSSAFALADRRTGRSRRYVRTSAASSSESQRASSTSCRNSRSPATRVINQ